MRILWLVVVAMVLGGVVAETNLCWAQTESVSPDNNSADAANVIEKSLRAVVTIRAQTPSGVSSGSGFVCDSSGIVVSNLHVVRDATQVAVQLSSGEVFDQIRVIGYDERRDLVVLKLPGFKMPTLPLGDSDSVGPGDTVFAIGSPLGIDELENTVTQGIVSGIRVLESGIRVIQTDAAVSSGNSGGPLLNGQGEVVGIVTFRVIAGDDLNFTIPINYVRGLLDLETQLTLSELNAELTDAVDLFEPESQTGISGDWKSLSSGTLKRLWTDGDYLYGETLRADGTALPATWTYELQKQEDGSYKGVSRSTLGGKPQQTIIRQVSENRLEYSSRKGTRGRWEKAVWVRQK